jgi:purine nucleosidase
MGRKSHTRVFLSHDGAVDDLVAMALVALSAEAELIGVSLVNGDCLAEPALEAQARLLALMGRESIPWSLSNSRAFNPFPWEYRGDCSRMLDLPGVRDIPAARPQPPFPDGERHLADALRAEDDGGITLLATGPLTPLHLVLEAEPALQVKVARIVWMGGAIDAAGNLDPATLPAAAVNSSAEWNAYWDPFAVDWMFRRTSTPILIVPLDVCDAAPITQSFLARLRASPSPLARLTGEAYAMVADQPFYRLWDVVAACAALEPALFEPPAPMRLVCETWGCEQGRIRRDPGGREVDVLMGLRAEAFYDFVIERLSR